MSKLRSILLVDDDDTTNFINQRVIDHLSIAEKVHVSLNGEEALAYLRELPPSSEEKSEILPDLILLDINMPVMNGFEFLEEFHNWELPHKEAVTIIMLSSSSHELDLARAKKFNVTDYINKPLTVDKLAAMMEKHFGLNRAS